MSNNSVNPTVTIAGRGPVLVIDHPPPVLGQLAVGRLEPDGETGTAPVLAKKAMFGFQRPVIGKVQAVVWAGLLPAVLGRLKLSGVPFIFANGTKMPVNTGSMANTIPGGTPVITGKMINPVTITDPAVVSFAAATPRGLVRYDADATDPLWLVVQVCIGLPDARIVVIVRRRKDATDLTALLRRHGISPATTGSGLATVLNGRVVVTLLGQMGMVELDKAHVVLVADPLVSTWDDPLTAAAAPDPNAPGTRPTRKPTGLMERLFDAGTARVLGFLPLHRRPSPFERARLWQLFGMHELVVPNAGRVERPVVVARVEANTGPTGKNAVGYVKNKVRMNPERNRRMAGLARALQGGDGQRLLRLSGSSRLAGYGNAPRHVLLLTENLKQAQALGRHLPGWPIVSGLGDDATVVKDDTTDKTRGVIATALGVEALTGDAYDVIVRADPGDGPPPLPAGWLATGDFPARRLLLVDVEDTGHHLAALWSRRRRRVYRAAGWAFLDEDPDVSAWKRFRELLHERRVES